MSPRPSYDLRVGLAADGLRLRQQLVAGEDVAEVRPVLEPRQPDDAGELQPRTEALRHPRVPPQRVVARQPTAAGLG